MIFATVGTQLPFDRLVSSVDEWAQVNEIPACFAQTGRGARTPRHMDHAATLTPSQFATHIAKCTAIVSHAGMGTILTALKYQKPIIIMPRLAAMGEHRNDHQLATARHVGDRRGIYVASDEVDLIEKLDRVRALAPADSVSDAASAQLLKALRDFIADAAYGTA